MSIEEKKIVDIRKTKINKKKKVTVRIASKIENE